jgi:hypothetical protein
METADMGVGRPDASSGSPACTWSTDDAFVAMSSILSFLPNDIGGGIGNMDPFDADPDVVIPSLLQVSDEYIEGTSATLEGLVEVRLIDGFHAHHGSEIIIRVNP